MIEATSTYNCSKGPRSFIWISVFLYLSLKYFRLLILLSDYDLHFLVTVGCHDQYLLMGY